MKNITNEITQLLLLGDGLLT